MRSHFHAVNSDLSGCLKLAAEIAAELSPSLPGVSLDGPSLCGLLQTFSLKSANIAGAVILHLPCSIPSFNWLFVDIVDACQPRPACLSWVHAPSGPLVPAQPAGCSQVSEHRMHVVPWHQCVSPNLFTCVSACPCLPMFAHICTWHVQSDSPRTCRSLAQQPVSCMSRVPVSGVDSCSRCLRGRPGSGQRPRGGSRRRQLAAHRLLRGAAA